MEVKLFLMILLVEVTLILPFGNKEKSSVISLKYLLDGSETDVLSEQSSLWRPKKILVPDGQYDEDLSLVVNGQIAKRGQFPYQVGIILMMNSLFGYLICGGSLISQSYVLTAAHCLYSGSTDSGWLAVFGGQNLNVPETGRVVCRFAKSDIILHENYSVVDFTNDIALVKLAKFLQISALIAPIQLPTLEETGNINSLVGSTAVISGWGRVADSSQNTSPVLKYGYVTVLDQLTCVQYYEAAKYNASETQICAAIGVATTNSCSGDSGGPMVVAATGKQIGIISLGSTLCELGFPALNTRVGAFLNWIALNSDVKIS